MRIFIALALFISSSVHAQLTGSLFLFGEDGKNNRGSASVLTEDGHLLYSGTFSNENDDVFLGKVGHTGIVIWEKNLGNNDSEFVNNMIRLSDGSVVIAGDVFDGASNMDGFLIRADEEDGSLIWRTDFGIPTRNEDFYALHEAMNGDILVCGFVTADAGSGNDILVARYDTAGNQIWRTTYGAEVNDYAVGITETPGGTIFVAGDRYVEDLGYNALFLTLDSDGEVLSEQVIEQELNSGVKTIFLNSSGKLIMSGESSSPVSPVFDIYFIQADTTGTLEEIRWLGETGLAEAGYDIAELGDQTYLITGFATNPVLGNNDITIMHADAFGNIYDQLFFGDTGVDYAYDIKVDDSGDYYVSGFSDQDGETRFALVTGSTGIAAEVQGIQNPFGRPSPNPGSGFVTLQLPEEVPIEVSVYDRLGGLVLFTTEAAFELNVPDGIYYILVRSEGQSHTFPLVVQGAQ
jgi:hypothetical protein